MVLVTVVVIVGLIALVCIIWSFFLRRHREVLQPGVGWSKTDEVFNDPSTNRQMRVWLDERGERQYVEEGQQPST